MPVVSKEELTAKFTKGDVPDSTDFLNLLDSCYNYSLSSLAVSAVP